MEIRINITIRHQEITDEIIDYLYVWHNDDEIVPYLFPNFEGEPVGPLSKNTIREKMDGGSKQHYIVYDSDKPVGELSILNDFTGLIKSEPRTAWIGICIGDKYCWRHGVGTLAIHFLEAECKKQGFQRIELGVFEHNQKAYGLYKKLGYEEFQRTPNFTWYNGVWYDDIRMEKYL